MDVRLYFKREERDEESQGKMQGNGQFEMGGALGGANIITDLLYFSGDNAIFYLISLLCYIIFCVNIIK